MKPGQRFSSHSRRIVWITMGLLVVYTIFGFFVAPAIIKSQLQQRGAAVLGRTVTVQKVRANPYVMSVTIEGLEVRALDGAGALLGWTRLYVNADPIASIFKSWKLATVEFDGFHAAARVHQDGSLNFSDILTRLQEQKPEGAPAKRMRPVEVDSLIVKSAQVNFEDQSRAAPFRTTVGPMTFTLTDFKTTGEEGAPYRFAAETEAGEKLAWVGTLQAAPLASIGEFRLENIHLPKYLAYYGEHLRVERLEGTLSMQGRYELNLATGARILKLTGGQVQLRDAKLWAKGESDPMVELSSLEVGGIDADALALKATVASVAVVGGHARLHRDQSGAINLLNLVPPRGAAPALASAPGSPASEAPDILVSEISVKNFQADVLDEAASTPARLGVKLTELSLENATLAEGATIPVKLAAQWMPEGSVAVTGDLVLRPEIKAQLKVEVSRLQLLPLTPYLEKFVNARLTQGSVSSSGDVALALAKGVPTVGFVGGVSLEELGIVDGAHSEELAGLELLTLSGVTANTAAPLSLTVQEVRIAKPYARIFVNADSSINLVSVAKPKAAAEPEPPMTAPAKEAARRARAAVAKAADAPISPKVSIGTVVIDAGEFSFTDRSVEPHVRLAVRQFGGTVSGLSSENLARADVNLKAAVDGTGPITITGQLDPLGVRKFVDVTLDFKNVDLLPFSPYSGKFAGYELARGKLALDVRAKLDDKQLDATNVITLNQFTFGAPVASADATKLPVRLGVALLKDSQGNIVIDVPMAGQIDDPELRIGKVVMRVIGNLLTKAATSPFALLGSMFGGGGDELAYQEFSPGSAELLPEETKKLETMVKALTNRPGLSVALEGGFDGPADTYALKRQKLESLIRARIWEERHAADPNIPPPDKLEISSEARATQLAQLFATQFPEGTELGEAPAAAPAAQPPPVAAPQKKSFLRKVVDVVTLKRMREPRRDPASPAPDSPPPSTPAAMDEMGAATGPNVDEMASRLADTQNVTENDLRALADKRAQRVRDYFLNEGKIAGDRLFLAQGSAEAKAKQGARVNLSLQ